MPRKVPFWCVKVNLKAFSFSIEIEKQGVIVKSESSFSEDPALVHIVEIRMLPFQLPGFVAFGVQFDGLFQIFEGAILVSFQVLGTAPFGVCFAEIGFQINRFVEESNGFIQTFLRCLLYTSPSPRDS